MLEKHGHGGDIWTAAELYGVDKNAFLDFSSNMNPLGPPEVAGGIIQEEWKRELSRYPDPDCRELRAKIADVYGIPAECVLVGNGAAELIDLAVRVLKPAKVGLLRPCFLEYAKAAERAEASVVDLPLAADRNFDPDWQSEELWDRAEQADILFLGHPNNPTGRLLPRPFLNRLMEWDKPVILDEAFIDFSGDEEHLSCIREAAFSERLFVVRSMTKFYTVPGLRLGFIAASPEWIARMKALQVEWSVNGLAQRIGAAVLGDKEYEEATLTWLRSERSWLKEALEQLGFQVTPSDANYLLFRLPSAWPGSIQMLQSRLGKKGIMVRDGSTFVGLDDRYGRTAVRLRKDNVRLIEGLAEALAELSAGVLTEGRVAQ
jgi:threonine-phosphate decarboxylase